MGKVINKNIAIDDETGEVVSERVWASYDGWKGDAYRFRHKFPSLKFYPDMYPHGLTYKNMWIFFMICMTMDTNNMFLRIKKARNSQIASRYEALDVEDIRNGLPEKVSEYAFEQAWRQIKKNNLVKRIRYKGILVWVVNPGYANRTDYLPAYLYAPFKNDIDNKITEKCREKYKNILMHEGINEYDFYK